ncbi:MAG TPA: glycosyltransferase family 4 protein [Pyrinomonadaceae bacterium]|nr:glycosyltransferase family 4 protein [Pyrinomonadaceae bacterium]
MKIVFYNHTGKVSGAERLLLNLLAHLRTDDFERLLLCPDDGPLAAMAAETGVAVGKVANLQVRFTWRPDRLLRYCKSFGGAIVHLRRQISDLNPDLIHANSIRAGLVATAATAGLKVNVVWHLHDLLPRHPLSCGIRAVAALSKRSRMIAVSDAVRRNFCGRWAGFLRRRVTVILNAIDPDRLSVKSADREEARARLALAPDNFAIGIVGQLTPRKGQLELLIAFAKLLRQVPQAVLVIVGAAIFNRDSEYEKLLHDTAQSLGVAPRVKMLGSRDDVPEIVTALDLIVINSRREPFGLVACEAMACGTPVLATARDGLTEIIRHQENGWLVPFGDEHKLIDAITFLQRRPDLRRKLAGSAREDVARHFTIERYMKDLHAFYQAIISENLVSDLKAPVSGQDQKASFA